MAVAPFNSNFKVTSPQGYRQYYDQYGVLKSGMHNGVDIDVITDDPMGNQIFASHGGTVTKVTSDQWRGNYIDITDDNGITRRYEHLADTYIKVGDNINAGDIIGKEGTTGDSTGVHLHYELFDSNGNYLDAAADLDGIKVGVIYSGNGRSSDRTINSTLNNNTGNTNYNTSSSNSSSTTTKTTSSSSSKKEKKKKDEEEDKNPGVNTEGYSYTPPETKNVAIDSTYDRSKLKLDSVIYLSDLIPSPNNVNQGSSKNITASGNVDYLRPNAETVTTYSPIITTAFQDNIPKDAYIAAFQRYNSIIPTDREFLELGNVYIFLTKPNLNITGDIDGTDQFSTFIRSNYGYIADSLTYSDGATSTPNAIPPYIPLISNNFKSISGIDDITTSEITYGETKRGLTQKLPGTSYPTRAGGTFHITYQELNPPLITYLHKFWFEYCENIKYGYIIPSERTRQRKEIDYTSSLYYFLVGPDGESIEFWCRFMGVVPQGIPYSAFASSPGEHSIGQITVPYLYSYKEYLEPQILQDFNDIVAGNGDIYLNGNDDESTIIATLKATSLAEFAGDNVMSTEALNRVYNYRKQNGVKDNSLPLGADPKFSNIEESIYYSYPHVVRSVSNSGVGAETKFRLILS